MPKISGAGKQVVINAVEDKFPTSYMDTSEEYNSYAYNLKESIKAFTGVHLPIDKDILKELLSDKVDYIEF